MQTKNCKAHLAHLTLPVEWLQCPPRPHWGTPDPAHFPPCCARKFCTPLLKLFQNMTVRGGKRQVIAKGCYVGFLQLTMCRIRE